MVFRKNDLFKLDLTPQRTSSYLSGRCGKICFTSGSFDEETPSSSPEEGTISQYFRCYQPVLLETVDIFDNSWISMPESKDHILYGEGEGGESEILYLSLEKFIEIISSCDSRSDELFEVFLYGYLSFSDDESIFRALIRRFHLRFPANISKSEKYMIYHRKFMLIQKKIIVFLQFWIEVYKETIVITSNLDRLFEETLFLLYQWNQYQFSDNRSDLSRLLLGLEEVRVYKNFRRFNETNFFSFRNSITSALTAIVFPIRDYVIHYPREISEQLCLFDFDNFYRISIPELLKKKQLNYSYFANQFNKLSKIIAFLILSPFSKTHRAILFEKIVEIIDFLIEKNDINSAFACFLGISHTAVERIKSRYMKKICKKTKEKLKIFDELFDYSNNQSKLREFQRKMIGPCVPFLGIYVKDMLNIEENAKMEENRTKLVDFRKCQRISMIIKEIDGFKEVWYEFEKNELLYDHFKYFPDVPDDILYEMSYIIRGN